MPLSRDLAAWLKEQGHDAEHTADVGLARASDLDILARAKREQRTIVTADAPGDTLKGLLMEAKKKPAASLAERGGPMSPSSCLRQRFLHALSRHR